MLRYLFLILIGPALALMASPSARADGPALLAGDRMVGRLELVWGDPPPGSTALSQRRFTVTDAGGRSIEVAFSDEFLAAHGGLLDWNRRTVRVHLAGALGPDRWRAQALTLLDEGDTERGSGPTGSQPWVSILCKFSDISDEPRDIDYFRGMYGSEVGGLDDYWRKQSYNRIDIVGSTAIDWVVLPEPQNFYVPEPGSGANANLNALFDDCTAAADPFVDFSLGNGVGFSGINIMLNGLLDCCAWGGSRFRLLDGVSKSWRTTWNPPWSYAQAAIIAHEMGHGFGLPHSNNFDGDSNPYDSPWDVMSAATNNAINDPVYGRQGKHHTAYHKDRLNWFAPGEVIEIAASETATITIDAMALAATNNYRMARIPIPDSDDWYTVEVRKRIGYDANLPGDAVVISHIDTSRPEPAWSVDTDVPPANYADNEGSMFRVGETFIDPTGRIRIRVDAETADGFVVTINETPAAEIFLDRFESSPP